MVTTVVRTAHAKSRPRTPSIGRANKASAAPKLVNTRMTVCSAEIKLRSDTASSAPNPRRRTRSALVPAGACKSSALPALPEISPLFNALVIAPLLSRALAAAESLPFSKIPTAIQPDLACEIAFFVSKAFMLKSIVTPVLPTL